jgi:chemotaxis protein methyltransferase CheR
VEEREFKLTDGEFARIRALVRTRAGIDLGDGKRAMVYGRLSRRLRALRLDNFADYLQLLADPACDEAGTFINALTTNVTEFLRERHHFDYLAATLLPRLRKTAPRGRRLRIWSAGCSTGEEPYTLAMTVRESFGDLSGWDAKILATDIDSDVLTFASDGRYPPERAERIPHRWRDRYFDEERSAGHSYHAKASIRSLITFKRLNLLEAWPMHGPFDAIFCRNVIIYFDAPTKLGLIRRFHQLLGQGGHLFLGHSESLVSAGLDFEPCGRTAYRKLGGGDAVAP